MTTDMGRVTCELSISADGYSAGLNQSEQRPFGDDGGDGNNWLAAGANPGLGCRRDLDRT